MLFCTAEGTVTGFGLANPKLVGEREAVRQLLVSQPANRPPAGSAVVPTRVWLEQPPSGSSPTWAADDPPGPHRRTPTSALSELAAPTVEAIIWTLKGQLGLEQHGGRVPAGLWVRVVQRLLALNTAIWHNWAIGAPVKRSLIAYDH